MRKPVIGLFLAAVLGCGGDLGNQVERAADALTEPAPTRKKQARAESRPKKKGGKGEVQVTTGAAVAVYVDGAPVTFDAAEGYVQRLSPGQHQMEVMNLLGKTMAAETIEVTAGQRTRYQYKTGGRLNSLGTTPIPEPVETTTAWVAPAAAAAQSGSVQIDGADSNAKVWIDGRAARFTGGDGFVSSNLTPGSHGMRVENHGVVVYDGQVDVGDGQNHRCVLTTDEYGAWTLNSPLDEAQPHWKLLAVSD